MPALSTAVARHPSQQRMDRRRAEDAKLQSYGWTKCAPGEWTHPTKRGVYLKWVALILCKEMTPPIDPSSPAAAGGNGGAERKA